MDINSGILIPSLLYTLYLHYFFFLHFVLLHILQLDKGVATMASECLLMFCHARKKGYLGVMHPVSPIWCHYFAHSSFDVMLFVLLLELCYLSYSWHHTIYVISEIMSFFSVIATLLSFLCHFFSYKRPAFCTIIILTLPCASWRL